MRHWEWPVTEKRPKELEMNEATAEYQDGKYLGFRVGRDKHGWFAFHGKARTVGARESGLITPQMLKALKRQLKVEGR